MPVAAALRDECTAYLAAQQAQEQRRHQDAVAAYRAFRAAHPRSVLVPFASEHLQRTYAAWAVELRQNRQFSPAVDVYRDLLAEVGRGPGAPQVRADLAATYLERSAAVRAQVAGANGVPPLGAVRAAVDDLQVVAQEFADTPGAGAVPQAMAETYTAATRGLGEPRYCDVLPVLEYLAGLPAGVPLGDDSPGSIPVTYVNDSPYEVTVRVVGPTAHEFVLPACAECSTYAEGARPSCRASIPSRTLFLRAGEYVDAVSSTVEYANRGDDARVVEPRYRYRTCLSVVSPLGGRGPI